MSETKRGRPRKKASEKYRNPQVQIGRHPQEEIDLIDAAADNAQKTRSEWAWEKLLRAAKRETR